jgi:quercetin dioxygenase-like cupin family protein
MEETMRKVTLIVFAVLGLSAFLAAADEMGHGVMKPDQLKWGPLDPKQPDGIQIAVLAGDPGKPGPFAMRAKFPAGFLAPSHIHSTDELVTVISGKAMVSWGVKTDIMAGDTLEPGTFFWLKGGEHHTFKAVDETVIELHSTGPFDMKIDP